MNDLVIPLKSFSAKVTELKRENSVIIRSVQKLWREHYDEEFIQSEAFIEDVDRVVEADFINLYQASVISLYTYLETAIKDLIVGLIIHYVSNEKAHEIPELATINISFIDYINLEGDQKYAYLATIFEKQQGASVPYGLERFERLLRPFNLNAAVDKTMKESINELAQTRNNLIHKAGIIDTWFMKQCGWLYHKYKVGDQLIVNHGELEQWMDVTMCYCNILKKRIEKVFTAR